MRFSRKTCNSFWTRCGGILWMPAHRESKLDNNNNLGNGKNDDPPKHATCMNIVNALWHPQSKQQMRSVWWKCMSAWNDDLCLAKHAVAQQIHCKLNLSKKRKRNEIEKAVLPMACCLHLPTMIALIATAFLAMGRKNLWSCVLNSKERHPQHSPSLTQKDIANDADFNWLSMMICNNWWHATQKCWQKPHQSKHWHVTKIMHGWVGLPSVLQPNPQHDT